MLDDEEERPSRKSGAARDLSRLSVGELEEYVARLEAEAARARAEIEARQSVRSAAEALFKKT